MRKKRGYPNRMLAVDDEWETVMRMKGVDIGCG